MIFLIFILFSTPRRIVKYNAKKKKKEKTTKLKQQCKCANSYPNLTFSLLDSASNFVNGKSKHLSVFPQSFHFFLFWMLFLLIGAVFFF